MGWSAIEEEEEEYSCSLRFSHTPLMHEPERSYEHADEKYGL
jgi:hypothetical protein